MNIVKLLSTFRVISTRSLLNTSYTSLRQTSRITPGCHQYSFNMAQRTITSFFKVTPPKTTPVKKEDKVEENGDAGGSPEKVEKKPSKRARLDSSGSESEPVQCSSPTVGSDKKKKVKRQRIESTSSESDTTPDRPPSPKSPQKPTIKVEKSSPKTYTKKSPTSKKTKPLKEKDTNSPKNSPKVKKETESAKQSPKVKKEVKNETESTKVKKETDSPKVKKEVVVNGELSSPSSSPVKDEVKVNGDESPRSKKENVKLVPELEYDPAKSKYNPIRDACWSKNQPVPYLALTRTLAAIEVTSARLRMVDILANYLRSVIELTPEDLVPSVYLCLNQLAPAYHSLELGIAETYLMKSIAACTGRTLAQVRSAARASGELSAVAASARSAQRTLRPPPPLTVRGVLAAFREIAAMTGQSSVNKKIAKIQSLYVSCRESEAKFLIRSLEGKLRVGLAEQSVLQALAVAVTPTNADKSTLEANALTIKSVYCECPNYELVVSALLEHGVQQLPQHCRLAPGLPTKPMLAHPTKGVHEIFNRFEGVAFTCEWKYDGERAQIHLPEGESQTPDFDNATVFSRNQENNTSKYPDVLRRLPNLVKPSVRSCILDCEAVAIDPDNKQILPFQILATRKRKDASENDIKVQVCVFVFDLLLLNGEPLVNKPLRQRRELLREHLHHVPGEWEFARSKDCSSMEEVQQFLEEAVKGSCEGLMVKTLEGDHAHYQIARRSRNWLKLKKDYLSGCGDSIDVCVLGAYRGKGRRTNHYGGFLCFARCEESDSFQALCKLGTGFTDEDLANLTEELDKHKIDAPRNYYSYDKSLEPDAWFSPDVVWEVRCADLSLSPIHRAAIGLVDPDKGISLRFPRFLRVRTDKSADQTTSARQIADMYLSQDQVKNQTNKPQHNVDDFY